MNLLYKQLNLKFRRSWLLFILILIWSNFSFPQEWKEVVSIPQKGEVYRFTGSNNHFSLAVLEKDDIQILQETIAPRYTDQILYFAPSEKPRFILFKKNENPNLDSEFKLAGIYDALNPQKLQVVKKLDDILFSWTSADHEQKLELLKKTELIYREWLKDPSEFDNDLPFVPTFFFRLLFAQYQYEQILKHSRQLDELTHFIPQDESFRLAYIQTMTLVNLGRFSQAKTIINRLGSMRPPDTAEFSFLSNHILALTGLIEIMQGSLNKSLDEMKLGKEKLENAISNTPDGDLKFKAILTANLATFYHLKMGQDASEKENEKRASQLYETSLQLHRESGSKREIVHALNNFALLKGEQQQPDVSLDMLRLILSIIGNDYPPEYNAVYYNNIASFYADLGAVNQSLNYYLLASEMWERSGYDMYSFGAKIATAKLYRSLSQFSKSYEVLKEVLESVERLNSLYKIRLYIEFSHYYLSQNDKRMADDFALKAKHLSGTEIQEEAQIELSLLLIELDYELGRWQSFKQGSDSLLARMLLSDKNIVQTIKIIRLKARWYREHDNHEAALSLLELALKKITNLSERIYATKTGIMWRSRINGVINDFLSLHYDIRATRGSILDNASVFKTWDSFNAASLVFARGHTPTFDPSSELSQLQASIWSQESELLSRSYDASLNKQVQLDLMKSKLTPKRKRAATDLAEQLNFSLEYVQSSMPSNEAIIGLHLHEETGYLFYVSETAFEMRRISDAKNVRAEIRALLMSIQENGSDYELHVSNVNELLGLTNLNIVDKRKFIVVSNDITQLIPFSVLIKQVVQADIEVINAYSVGSYFAKLPIKLESNNSIAIFANPSFGPQESKELMEDRLLSRDNLPSLPWSSQEAKWISSVFPTTSFSLSGYEASIQNLLSPKMRNATIQHIATHAVHSSRFPSVTGLATSAVNNRSNSNFDFASISRLASYPTTSQLIVLSGCETMLGEIMTGEGHLSVSRALLANGAGGTIATLWPVADKPTAIFMKFFYVALKTTNGNVSKSLSQAQQQMFKTRRYKHPKFWAPFVFTASNRQFSRVQIH